jgi:hypothetical protein
LDILSRKTTVPFKATENVLLIKRYFIPWQFREENKTFAEIDNYLALATQFLASSPLHPGLGMDAGMICHHRDITFEVGGYDESMGGWGKSDTNFCLRAGRKYPLLNLSGFGVHCYDFEPNSITIKNKIRKQNKTKDIAINELNQSWGLNGTNLNEQQCEIVEDYQPNQTSRNLNRQVVSDLLTERSAKETVKSLSFNNLVVEPSYYFIGWHIRNFFSDTFVEFLPSDVRQSSKLKMPECAADPCGAATVVSTMNPTATICSVFAESRKTKNHHDHKILAKQYVNKHGGRLSFINTLLLEMFPPNTHIHKWMRGFGHQFHKGIVSLVTGSEAHILDRLGRHLTPYRKIDICLINQDSVESPALITEKIWPLLKMYGIILYQSATSSESAEYKQAACRELENCQAMILSTLVILVKGAPPGIWETLKTQETALSKRLKRRTRPFAYLKSYAFDIMRRIAVRG